MDSRFAQERKWVRFVSLEIVEVIYTSFSKWLCVNVKCMDVGVCFARLSTILSTTFKWMHSMPPLADVHFIVHIFATNLMHSNRFFNWFIIEINNFPNYSINFSDSLLQLFPIQFSKSTTTAFTSNSQRTCFEWCPIATATVLVTAFASSSYVTVCAFCSVLEFYINSTNWTVMLLLLLGRCFQIAFIEIIFSISFGCVGTNCWSSFLNILFSDCEAQSNVNRRQ